MNRGETYTVGQVVWVASRQRWFSGRSAVVTKIGRKWITLDDGRWRFDPATGRIDGGRHSCPGVVWPSKAHADAHADRQERWRAIAAAICNTYSMPAHLTDEDVATLAAILRIPPSAEAGR